MKYGYLFLIALCVTGASAQSIDSIAYKQVDSLVKASKGLLGKKEFIKALELNTRAEEMALSTFGEISASFGNACHNHGRIMLTKSEYPEAEKWLLKSKSIYEKTIGIVHTEYANNIINLGILYKAIGQYKKAEPLFLNAIAIREKKFGKVHPDYAASLSYLAGLYLEMGQYEKVESLYLEVKTIREKTLGKNHPDYAGILTNLANFYYATAQYEKAELFFLEAKGIHEKVIGKSHLFYAMNLYNLAILYKDMGQYEKAESLFLEAKEFFEKNFSKVDPNYASCVNNLALVYLHMRLYEKAQSHYLEAIAIQEKILGKDHPGYAKTLNNLASLYMDLGQYENAETLYLEAKTIFEKTFGLVHPVYASSMINLANLYWAMGQYEKAEPLYLEAKAIREKVLGRSHPDYAESLGDLANLYYVIGQYENAELYFNGAFELQQKNILSALHHLSEKEMNLYLQIFKDYENVGFSFIQNTGDKTAGSKKAYDNTLFYKGFLLHSSIQSKQLLVKDTAVAAKYKLLRSLGVQLSKEYSKPIAEQKGVNELEEESNLLEKEIARTVAGYEQTRKQISWKDVQQKLKTDEAAIEFVNYQYRYKHTTDSVMYAALLIKSGSMQPKFISLFEEKSLDSLLHSKSERKADYVNSLYTLADRGAVGIEAPKKSLHELLWKPLDKELIDIKTIYFSPAGLLHRINLDAIPISETETLADKYQLIELNSTRELVLPDLVKPEDHNAILFGGIQFEQDSTIQIEEPLIASRSRGELSFNNMDSTLRGGSWNYLAGTEREVNSIEKILLDAGVKTTLKKGYSASEGFFKSMGENNAASPRILHVATHGYFFPDPKAKVGSSQLAVPSQEPVFKISDHPMLRSGLIMAGGNAAWQGKQSLEGKEDGILTAYEISQMNLSNTELVVLSACETGLGDIQGNEGVYGLQRAFKIAGVKYLIMSLWQVPDKQTSLLMTTFYKKWLGTEGPSKGGNKMSIPDAFHAAQRELRDMGLDPYQWAGFVLVE